MVVSDIESSQAVRTHPIPDETDRVFKPRGHPAVEVMPGAALLVHASHFMIVPAEELGNVRQAAYFNATKVPAVVDDPRFLGACELLKLGDKPERELVFRAITQEFMGIVSKKSKKERCDIVHCWSVNDASRAKIAENYLAEKYVGVELSSDDKAAFDAFFAMPDDQRRIELDLESEAGKKTAAAAGFEPTDAYAAIDKSSNTIGKLLSKEAKNILKVEELLAENEHLRKKARLIDGEPTINASGEVSFWLKVRKEGEDGQILVNGRMLDGA